MSGITGTMSFIIPGRGGRGVQENGDLTAKKRTLRARREVRGLTKELDRSVNNMQELPGLQK